MYLHMNSQALYKSMKTENILLEEKLRFLIKCINWIYLLLNLKISFWNIMTKYITQNVQILDYIISIVALFKVKHRKNCVYHIVVKQTVVHMSK